MCRILDFWCRLQTCRTPEQARRSFYKYVCTRGYYAPLKLVVMTWREAQWYNVPVLTCSEEPQLYHVRVSRQWTHGYPLWETPRSQIRDQWEYQFKKHRDKIEEQVRAERDTESGVWEKRFQFRAFRRSPVYQLTRLTNALHRLSANRPLQNTDPPGTGGVVRSRKGARRSR